MEKEKYYIPEISELREGYEFEYQEYDEEKDQFKENWIKSKFDSRDGLDYDLAHQFADGSVRCKFLTIEQIEAEGWIKVNANSFVITSMKSDKFDSNVEYSLTFNRPRLTPYINIDGADTDSSCYRGMCKSINEMRTIMKLLRIN